MRNTSIILFSLLFVSLSSFGQNTQANELGDIYNNEQLPDSIRVDAAIDIADQIYYSDLDSTLELINQAKDWSTRSNYKFGLARVDGYLGFIYHGEHDFIKAISYYRNSINYNLENGFELQRAMDLGNYGTLLNTLDEPKSIDFIRQSISIYKAHNKLNDLSYLYANLGNYFVNKKMNDSALYYFHKGYKFSDSQAAKASFYTGIAICYVNQNKLDSAEFYSKKTHQIALEMHDSTNIRSYYQIQMEIKYKKNEIDSALYFGEIANTYQTNIKLGMVKSYHIKMGRILFAKKKYKAAYEALDSAYSSSIKSHSRDIYNSALREAINFEYKQKHLADSLNYIRDKELKESTYKMKLEAEAQMRYGLYIGITFLGIVFILLFRGYQRKKKDNAFILKQKEEVEIQKKLMGKKNKEILDSIHYAKRIQTAILPSTSKLKELVPNSFIIYKPKDIVAGDFYWLEPTKDGLLFAVADCTGHGVPGAMVSVICNTALNRSVRENNLSDPGEILNKTKALVLSEFETSENEVKDGMDIALCALKNNELQFSGANRSLWIMRNGELIEIKGDKQPIGKFRTAVPFKTKTIQVAKGDQIYLFSDGFTDQFGGPREKKLKYVLFKELLFEIEKMPLEEQNRRITSLFDDWKGDIEQVDDVCLWSIRI